MGRTRSSAAPTGASSAACTRPTRCSPTSWPSASAAPPASGFSPRGAMSRRILLVDADVNALGALASALRARGLTVYNASEVYEAVEQAFKHRPDVILVTRDLDGAGELVEA